MYIPFEKISHRTFAGCSKIKKFGDVVRFGFRYSDYEISISETTLNRCAAPGLCGVPYAGVCIPVSPLVIFVQSDAKPRLVCDCAVFDCDLCSCCVDFPFLLVKASERI